MGLWESVRLDFDVGHLKAYSLANLASYWRNLLRDQIR